MWQCYFMQWIDKIVKYIDNEAIKDYNRQTHKKHNKFNKDFIQYSWATSPGLAFRSDLSIMSSSIVLQYYELNLRLNTQQI